MGGEEHDRERAEYEGYANEQKRAMAAYANGQKRALGELLSEVYDKHGISLTGVRLYESVRYDGNWFVAEDRNLRWRIEISVSDGTTRWRRFEREQPPWVEVTDG